MKFSNIRLLNQNLHLSLSTIGRPFSRTRPLGFAATFCRRTSSEQILAKTAPKNVRQFTGKPGFLSLSTICCPFSSARPIGFAITFFRRAISEQILESGPKKSAPIHRKTRFFEPFDDLLSVFACSPHRFCYNFLPRDHSGANPAKNVSKKSAPIHWKTSFLSHSTIS